MQSLVMLCRHGSQPLSEVRSWDMRTFHRFLEHLAQRLKKEFPPSPLTGGAGPRGRHGA